MLTVCLSTYNGEKFLQEQLNSLNQQTFKEWQLLIRDDGSTDGTIELVQSYRHQFPERVRLIEDTLGNLGSSQSFMELLKYAKTRYIMLCDQDDIWMPHKIESSLHHLHTLEKKYGSSTPLAIFSDMQVINTDQELIDPSFWHYQKLDPALSQDCSKLLAQNVISGCTLIINHAAKNISLPFKIPTMMHDHWIGVNVAKYGKIDFITPPTLLYRQHQSNVEGAHHYGWLYALKKMKHLLSIVPKMYHSSRYFEISIGKILWYKFILNLTRLLTRS